MLLIRDYSSVHVRAHTGVRIDMRTGYSHYHFQSAVVLTTATASAIEPTITLAAAAATHNSHCCRYCKLCKHATRHRATNSIRKTEVYLLLRALQQLLAVLLLGHQQRPY
jgi:hypothetical protein